MLEKEKWCYIKSLHCEGFINTIKVDANTTLVGNNMQGYSK